MRSIHILPLLAIVPLLGCDGTGDWLRGSAAATAYAAPLASDTTVVTARRVMGWPNTSGNVDLATIMPNGAGLATTDWNIGDPAVFDLASKEFHRLRINDMPYDTGIGLFTLPSPDGSRVAVGWQNHLEPQLQLRILDVATGASRTIMAPDTAITRFIWPVAWTPAEDSVFVSLWPSYSQGGDVKVVLIPAAGGTPRLVHTIPQRRRAEPWRMSLSPDGRWLLYDHELWQDQKIRSDIHIIDVRGGGARAFIEHPALDLLVGWLPGSDVVLFSSDRSGTVDLWSVPVVNGRPSAEPRRVRSGFFRTEAVGFGGGALFYRVETGSRGPAVINVDPQSWALVGAASPPLEDLRRAFYEALAWSPDGQTLAASDWGSGSRTITLHSMETGESRVFWLDEDVYPLRIEWAADGKALVLKVGEAGWTVPTGPHHFLRLDLVTGTTTRLFAATVPEEASRFRVTPDGRSIVLLQQRSLENGQTGLKLVLRSLGDGSERELHRTSGFIPEFSISADGTQLAFMQQAGEDSDSLFVMRMDRSQPMRALVGWDHSWDDAVSLLGWLPAGNALLAARLTEDGTGEEILRIELDGSVTVVGTSPFPPTRGQRVQGYHRSRLVLSPAGNRLAHVVDDIGEELWRMDGLPELFAR